MSHYTGRELAQRGRMSRSGGWFHDWSTQNVDKTFVRENETGARVNAARLEYTHET